MNPHGVSIWQSWYAPAFDAILGQRPAPDYVSLTAKPFEYPADHLPPEVRKVPGFDDTDLTVTQPLMAVAS